MAGFSIIASYPVGPFYVVKTDENGNSGCYESNLILYDSLISFSVSSPLLSVTTGGAAISSVSFTACGCAADTVFCSGNVGINEMNISNDILVFPNPFSYSATIELDKKIKKGVVKIFDLFGREISNTIFFGNRIELFRNELSEGIYFIQIISEHSIVACEKIIIQ